MKLFALLAVLLVTPYGAKADLLWELRVGAKGAFTGNLFYEPESAPPNTEIIWGDTQFYIGGGGGFFVELNLLKFLGFEVDVLYEANALTFKEDYGGFEYDYNTRYQQIRIPVLVKGVLPMGNAELSLGLGPEFVIGLGAGVDFDYHTAMTPAQKQAADQTLHALYDAEEASDTFLDVDFGVNIKVWKLFIPISLRVGFNLTQPSDYEDRVDLTISGTSIINARVKAIESYHFTLMAGAGYVF
jgi:hypothetical protein